MTAIEIARYEFANEYGIAFYDYSGNEEHAVNGIALANTSQDAGVSDRGVYFVSNEVITLPANEL